MRWSARRVPLGLLAIGTVFAAFAGQADSGITFDLEPETVLHEGSPGQTVAYVLTLTNKDVRTQEFRVEIVTAPVDWAVEISPDSFFLPAGQNGTVTVELRSPTTANATRSFTARATNNNLTSDIDDVTLVYEFANQNQTTSPVPSNTSTSAPPPSQDTSAPTSPLGTPETDAAPDPGGETVSDPGDDPGPGAADASTGPPFQLPTIHPRWTASAAAAIAVLYLAWFHEGTRFRILWAGAGLFSRLERSTLMEHSVRERIVAFVHRTPGVHYTGLKRGLGLANGVLVHHLRVLQRERLLRSSSDGFRKRFYPPDIAPGRVFHPTAREAAILSLVQRTPGILQRDLARSIGASKQVTNYHLHKLHRAGHLHAERDGRRLLWYPRRSVSGSAANTKP